MANFLFLLLLSAPGPEPPRSSPSSCPLPLSLGFQRREDITLLLSVALRLGTLAPAGSLVSLLMLRSSISEKMLWGSLLPQNFHPAIFPECPGGRVGWCGDVGDPVGGHTRTVLIGTHSCPSNDILVAHAMVTPQMKWLGFSSSNPTV